MIDALLEKVKEGILGMEDSDETTKSSQVVTLK